MRVNNEVKVGILTITALLVLILGYNFLRGSNIFSSSTYFFALYKKVDGLSVSKPVLINGFQIGRVAEMKLKQDGRILVKLEIFKGYPIALGTVARLESTDLLGNKAIVFQLSSSSKLATANDTLSATNERSLSETVAPLQGKTEKLLTRIDSLLATLNSIVDKKFQKSIQKSVTSAAGTLAAFDSFSGVLNKQGPRVERIMRNVETLSGGLSSNTPTITRILGNLNSLSEKASKADLGGAIAQASGSMTQLNSVLNKINAGQGSLGLLVNDRQLYSNLANSIASLNRLMIDLKANPKRYVSFSVFGGGKKKDSTQVHKPKKS